MDDSEDEDSIQGGPLLLEDQDSGETQSKAQKFEMELDILQTWSLSLLFRNFHFVANIVKTSTLSNRLKMLGRSRSYKQRQ